MADAIREIAPSDEQEWRRGRVVTVELEITAAGEVTYARGWLEKRLDAKGLGLACEGRQKVPVSDGARG